MEISMKAIFLLIASDMKNTFKKKTTKTLIDRMNILLFAFNC